MKKIKPYIINTSFILFIFLLSLYLNKSYPFGNISIGLGDATAQYKPFLYNYITSIKNGTLESYSFIYGLGNPTYANFIYYLSSPLNLIAIFFKTPESMFLSTIVLKVLLTSITSTYYFKKKTNNNFITTICTLAYIFSGWFFAHYYISIWLDIFMLFPIYQLSLERLLKARKNHLFIITFSLCLITNFYLAYMIGLYTIIYFIIDTFIINNKDKLKDKIYKFDIIALSTLVSLLLSTVFLYLVYLCFTRQILVIKSTSYYYIKSIIEFIKNMFVGNILVLYTNEGVTVPNFCTSMLVTISSLYYFLNNKISKKEKLISLLGIIIVLIFTFSKTADLIANLYHPTIGINFRYSFIISFYMIILLVRNYKTFDNNIDKKVYIPIILLFITLLLLYKKLSFEIFTLNLVILTCYTIFLIFYTNNRFYKYLLIPIIILECITPFYLNINKEIKIDEEYIQDTNITTFREKDFHKDLNYNYYDNTNYITSFTSMQNGHVMTLFTKLDITTNKYNYIEYNSDSFNDMFFNIKQENYLEKIFTINSNIINLELSEDSYQNKLEIAKIIGIENIYSSTIKEPIKEQKDRYIYEISSEDKYITFKTKTNDDLTIKIDQKNSEMYLPKDYISNPKITFIKYDEEKLNELYNKLSQNQIEYTKYSDSYIEGYINVPKDEIIYTSIPYDQNWIIKVDGKKVNQIKLLDALTGIECKEGKHKITLEYKVHYEVPLLISVSTLLLLTIDYFYKKKKQNTSKI